MIEKKMEVYDSCLLFYGALTLCYLIKKYEEEENYEECTILKAVLEKRHLPTTYNEKLIKETKNAYKQFGVTGTNMLTNLPVYAEKVITKINQL